MGLSLLPDRLPEPDLRRRLAWLIPETELNTKVKPRSFSLVPWDAPGPKGAIYTILYEGESQTELDRFLDNPAYHSSPDFDSLVIRLEDMMDRFGFREQFFTSFKKYPHPFAALRYEKGPLRIYCCRYGSTLLIAGGGGLKPPGIGPLQDDPTLDAAYKEIVRISGLIDRRVREGGLRVQMYELDGDLAFNTDDEPL